MSKTEPRRCIVKVGGRSVELREPGVRDAELAATRLPSGASGRVRELLAGSALTALCIVAIDGKPVDQGTFSPRQEFPLLWHWNVLGKALAELMDGEAPVTVEADGTRTVTASDGRRVRFRALTLEEVEAAELSGRYGPKDAARALNDRTEMSIVSVDGVEPRKGFQARTEWPLLRDWIAFGQVVESLNGAEGEEDPEAFLRPGPSSATS